MVLEICCALLLLGEKEKKEYKLYRRVSFFLRARDHPSSFFLPGLLYSMYIYAYWGASYIVCAIPDYIAPATYIRAHRERSLSCILSRWRDSRVSSHKLSTFLISIVSRYPTWMCVRVCSLSILYVSTCFFDSFFVFKIGAIFPFATICFSINSKLIF